MKSQFPITSFVSLAIAFLCSGSVSAIVKPNSLFTDGAVLQRDQPVPIWGTASDGEKVTVELAGQKLTTTATDGTWRVDLRPLTAGGPFAMTISGENTVRVNNLLVGEVWVCSGQSNMAFSLNGAATAKQEIPQADFPEIRMFTVRREAAITPQEKVKGSWVECSPQTAARFSAVGYFFARDLHRKLGVPVGMINTSWGATPAEAWTSIDGFGDHSELQGYVDLANKTRAEYPAAVAARPARLEKYKAAKKAWDESVGKSDQEALQAWKAACAKAKRVGQARPPKPVPASPAPEEPPSLKIMPSSPSVLHNGMVAPIIPYRIKGTIWYQGESNVMKSREYRSLFPAMINDWRAKWGQGNFPFLFVQIAPFNRQLPEIREAQFLTLAKSNNTAMAVTTDVGDPTNIHPNRKEPVGRRLALAARAVAYGEEIEYSGPLYQSMQVKGDAITVSFSHIGGGLIAKDGALKGFTIAGADGNFVPAKAVIQGPAIVVSAEGVVDPKAVRYGWANVPDVNLFNGEGLPASPFRTDVD